MSEPGPDPLALARARAAAADLPMMAEADWPAEIRLPPGLSARFLRGSVILPLGPDDQGVERVAVADPANLAPQEALAAALGRRLALRVASVPAILARLDGLAQEDQVVSLPDSPEDDGDSAIDAPVIALLDRLLAQAVADRATDLHFEPQALEMVVRQRVDGVLRVLARVPAATGRALVARIKILSRLNIAERRLPQDGHFRAQIAGSARDMRVATLPLVEGEGAALRLLADRQNLPRIGGLGLVPRDEAALRDGLAQSHGLILVTGPTGSGKTTTLAAAVSEMNAPGVKIISVEDPVEYHIAGVAQVQVSPAIGLSFATGLRAFMRADPDILLVGEVRDPETAAITVQAALTGHLVLTTLHTNSAAGAVMRLTEMGVEPYLLAATLRVSVGQRLIRRLCPHCKRPDDTPLPDLLAGATGQAYTATGCDQCGQTGYYGRRAIFEVLTLTDPLRRLVVQGTDTATLHREAMAQGMTPLVVDGLQQVMAGMTSVAEVLRVVRDG